MSSSETDTRKLDNWCRQGPPAALSLMQAFGDRSKARVGTVLWICRAGSSPSVHSA